MGSQFGAGSVVVGLLPDQDTAVLRAAVSLAVATDAQLLGAYVDPASILIEWDPEGDIASQSLELAVGPDDDVTREAHGLELLLEEAAKPAGLTYSFRILGGDPAKALGRLAAAESAAVIVVGARHPGLLARVDEALAGSVVRRLLSTQPIPVLAVPRVDAHRHL
jgi:nucleotide-binding universal stress UspA family protein